jgi:hypothetical protein
VKVVAEIARVNVQASEGHAVLLHTPDSTQGAGLAWVRLFIAALSPAEPSLAAHSLPPLEEPCPRQYPEID